MKNFSTGAARSLAARTVFAIAAAWLVTGSAEAAAECKFRPNAPDKHVVVKHDTLWDISGKFLEHPWCWPQVWGMNKEEIRNPHWIYPGQTIWFDRARGRLTLVRPGDQAGGASGVTRLSPQIRTEPMGAGAIQSVSRQVIDGLISRSLVVEAGQLEAAPRIVAGSEAGRIYLGKNDRVYVRGNLDGVTEFDVFRPGKPLTDPDTGKVMAYEATNVGKARLVTLARPGVDVHTFEVTDSTAEMGVGDRLRPVTPLQDLNYVPHAPLQEVHARVMSIATEANQAAQNQIVTVNRGELDGLDIGSVLVLYHAGRTVEDPNVPGVAGATGGGIFGLRNKPVDDTSERGRGLFGLRKQGLRLPDEEIGNLFVFRVYGHVAYGVILQSKAPVNVGDLANSPE